MSLHAVLFIVIVVTFLLGVLTFDGYGQEGTFLISVLVFFISLTTLFMTPCSDHQEPKSPYPTCIEKSKQVSICQMTPTIKCFKVDGEYKNCIEAKQETEVFVDKFLEQKDILKSIL